MRISAHNYVKQTLQAYDKVLDSFDLEDEEELDAVEVEALDAEHPYKKFHAIMPLLENYYEKYSDRKRIVTIRDVDALAERIFAKYNPGPVQLEQLKELLRSVYAPMKLAHPFHKRYLQRKSTLNPQNIQKFLQDIYYPLQKRVSEENQQYPTDEMIATVEVALDFFNKKPNAVVSKFTLRQMQETFTRHGLIQFRPISPKATTLVLGCGHSDVQRPRARFDIGEVQRQIDNEREHRHKGEVTVDLDMLKNPDVVACVGEVEIAPIFKGKKFSRIIFEGFMPDVARRTFIQDLLDCLEESGRIELHADERQVDITDEIRILHHAVQRSTLPQIRLTEWCRERLPA